MHCPGIPLNEFDDIREATKHPEGTIEFQYSTEELFNDFSQTYILMEIPTGAILFRLERDELNNMHFIHSSPGTNTRIASVNLNQVKDSEDLSIVLRWSPEETNLDIFSRNPEVHLKGIGVLSQRKFMVDEYGNVHQIGDEGVEVREVRVYSGGKPVIQPPAIEAWSSTIESCQILLSRIPQDDYIYECICSNLTIIMLVTGFETYCKSRFLELESEGINPKL